MNKFLILTAALGLLAATASAQSPWSCSATVGSPRTIRAQGIAEPVSDVIVTCSGAPTGSTGGSFAATFTLTFNAPVTSQFIDTPITEALALINVPPNPLVENTSAGVLTSSNTLQFSNIFLTNGATTTIRFTNVRVNATQVSGPVTATVSVQPAVPSNFTQQTVAVVQPGLTFDTRTCNDSGPANNPTYLTIPGMNTAVLTGGQGTINFNVRFSEPFPFDFRPRIAPTQDPSTPGNIYNSESMFVATQTLGFTVGEATQGTQLLATFQNVPAGVRLFVTTRPLPQGSSSTIDGFYIDPNASYSTFANISATASATCAAGGSAATIIEIPVTNGAAQALWEISASDPQTIEKASFGVVVAYDTAPGAGTATVNGVLAPLGTGARSATPEFIAVNATTDAFTIATNPRPVILTSSPLTPGTVGQPYTFNFQGTSGTPPYRWAIASTDTPFPVVIDPNTGVLTATPTAARNSYTITVNLFDSIFTNNPTQKTFSWRVDAARPVITTNSPITPGTVGQPYAFQFQAAQGTPPYRWAIASTDAPFPIAINPTTGLLTATPTVQKNSYTITVNLFDSNFATDPTQKTFLWRVDPAALTITTTALPEGFLQSQYNAQVQATGGSGGNVFTFSGALPPGLSFTNGIFAGVPTTEGSYPITISVADNAGATNSRPFTIVISRPNLTVSIGTRALAPGVVGQPYSQQVSANGGIKPLTWKTTGLPKGLAIDQNGVIAGTPTEGGTFQVNIIVNDVFGNGDNVLLPLTVTGGALTLVTTSLPDGTAGSTYNTQLVAAGGTPPYTFVVTGLPSGLTFANGAITGKPDAAGTSNVTIVLTDTATGSVTKTLPLVVNPGPPQITTVSLPAGTVGAPFTPTVAATGGTGALTWSLVGPPAAFSINSQTGQITGSFANTNPVTLTVRVTDTLGRSSEQTYPITVNALTDLQITTPAALPPNFVGDTMNFTIGVTGGAKPYTFALTGGAAPAGASFDAATGSVKGPLTATGPVSFTITVTDAAKQTKSQTFTGQVLNPVTIPSQTLTATVGTAFDGKINVTGGVAPFKVIIAGGAPAGLTFDPATGQFSGSPNAAGNFPLSVAVTDAANRTAQQTIPLTISFPAVSGVNVGGLPAAPAAGGQAQNLTVGIGGAFPAPVTGTLTLTFAPDAVVNGDDPNISFSNGKRSAAFNVKQGDTAGTFTDPNLGIQLGTVAGTITLTTTLQSNGTPVPCNCTPQKIVIPRGAPVIRSVVARRTAGGFTVDVTGFSSSRELTSATFRFTQGTAGNLQTNEATVQVGPVFTTYFQGADGLKNGSLFTLTQPFTINGDQNAVSSVTVTLTNAQGTSAGTSANIQ